jgi:hypothetical protein
MRLRLPYATIIAIAFCLSAPAQAADAFWISVVEDGAYRVDYDALAALEPLGVVDSALLAVTNKGQDVPIWVNDGGDGSFGPGDYFEFIGSHLASEISFYDEHSKYNAYHLTLGATGGARMMAMSQALEGESPVAPLTVRQHLEDDKVMVRFTQKPGDPDTETWFWRRLSFLDKEPFETRLSFNGLGSGPARVRIQARGWSRHRLPAGETMKQHRIEVDVNGSAVTFGDWDGQDYAIAEGEIAPELLKAEDNQIKVVVPPRSVGDSADPMIDLSLLNWIEIEYPHTGSVAQEQTQLTVGGSGRREARVEAPGARSLVAYDNQSRRWAAPDDDGNPALAARFEGPEATLLAVRDGSFRSPAGIAVDFPSAWRQPGRRADYLIVAHPTLLAGSERLAAYHRSRGLEVAVIDVQDAYDEFNYGIVHPRAIRDLVAYAYREWAAPAPRFLLLVGDASWDVERGDSDDEDYADWSYQPREAEAEGFLKNKSTPYASGPANRALIPTGSYHGAEGHAASDNYFVAIDDDDDFKPVLAVGRLPIVDPADLDAIVDKTIRYIEESGVGPWRRKLLLISNEAEYIQRASDALATEQATRGFASEKVYPLKDEASNDLHQQRLLEAFAEGELVVHFHGHGGRYIWRTGATDYKKNRDLFNLDHLDQLEPSPRLPIVLSMTCFSAPFDHPLADSIGEKFLRLPDRGAIAVLAASWRNSPASAFSRSLIEQLTRPQTIGEAILHAKREVARRDMVETYNLLGDPAVPIAAPQTALTVELAPTSAGRLGVSASLPTTAGGFAGRALIEWFDADGALLASQEIPVSGTSFEAVLDDSAVEPRAVNVYAWDSAAGVDGLGALAWGDDVDQAPPEAVPGPASP